jgi:mono/diheme cytochrome c family protein
MSPHPVEKFRTRLIVGMMWVSFVLCSGNSILDAQQASVPTDEFETIARPFLNAWCIDCHTGDDAEAGLDMSRFDSQKDVEADLKTWKSIIEAIDHEFMPPAEEEQPVSIWVKRLKNWYLKSRVAAGEPSRPIPRMRRLNRTEYENTITDLLRIDSLLFTNSSQILLADHYFNAASKKMPRYVLAMTYFSYGQKRPSLLPGLPEVPSDPAVEHGYSNDHEALSFSPLQAERYFEMANSIINSKKFAKISGLWNPMFLPPNNATIAEQKLAARGHLQTFLGRAFRRDATKVEVDRYAGLFDEQFSQTGNYTTAMKISVTAVLNSPSFLFRQDFSAGSFDDEQVNQFAMASRLSYFLWASMPDDHLFQAAREGRLGTREGLVKEVRRMMNDKKIKSLATDFGMQWLKVASVASAQPDRDLFPKFYKSKKINPAVSMVVEQLLFFETVMIEDRNIMEFIHSDWGYINQNLIQWYGLDSKAILGYTPKQSTSEDFFRVKWPNDQKGGVITSGATLVSTSATTRTSPVYRGAWILDVIFNRPPPAPPANVPSLDQAKQHSEEPKNVVEKLKIHREDANCAVCHDRIDPMGYALEGFDAVGRMRQQYENGTTIEATGIIFDEEFDGSAQFKNIILRNEREFVQGFTEHMSKYALGRRLELQDEEELKKIVDAVVSRGNFFSAVVEEIVTSDLFRSPPNFATKKDELPETN